jgi:hypothetical protein
MNFARRVEKLLPFDTCAQGTILIKVAVMMMEFI